MRTYHRIVHSLALLALATTLKAQPSTLGANWTLATNAPWAGRTGAGAVAFNGRMWVMGGQGGPGRLYGISYYSDVWSSSDGVTWTCVTNAAPWGGRCEFGLVVFNNQMWVLGGSPWGSLYLNDVWSSSDGVTWTCATNAAAWCPRTGLGTVAFNGQMWVMGGNSGGWLDFYNDVWSSSDGVTWTQVTGNAGWAVRGYLGAVVFNDQMWVMGGANIIDNAFGSDVWSSSNGITWTCVTNTAPWTARCALGAAAFNGSLWVMGGLLDEWGTLANDVWSSADGANWTQMTNTAPWSPRSLPGVVAFNDRLWLMGGGTDSFWPPAYNDVWASPDLIPPSLTGIVVTPADPVVIAGLNQAFSATGHFSDGSSGALDSANGLVWSSGNPGVAAIDTNGVATGLSAGQTTITATCGNISATTVLTVRPVVQNGSFETGNLTNWTLTGNTAYVSVSAKSDYVHAGGYGAQLGPVGALGYLSQTLPTSPGQPYLLSLWLDSPEGATPNEFTVSWNGTTLFDAVNLGAIGWTNLQFIVGATSATSQLQIGARNAPSYFGLDDITLAPLLSLSPQITLQPASQCVPIGGLAQFTETTVGTPPLAYQWYFNTNTPVLGMTNAALGFCPVTTNLAGAYQLVVTNLYGCATSSPAVLTVELVPYLCGLANAGGGAVTLSLASIPGSTNRLWASTDLVQWQVVATNIADSNGFFQITDTNAVGQSRLFYRLSFP